jgi:hypothetical protein
MNQIQGEKILQIRASLILTRQYLNGTFLLIFLMVRFGPFVDMGVTIFNIFPNLGRILQFVEDLDKQLAYQWPH